MWIVLQGFFSRTMTLYTSRNSLSCFLCLFLFLLSSLILALSSSLECDIPIQLDNFQSHQTLLFSFFIMNGDLWGFLDLGWRYAWSVVWGFDSLGNAYSQSGPVNIGLTFVIGLMLIGPYISMFLHYFLEIVFC